MRVRAVGRMDRCFVAYDARLNVEFQGDVSVPTHPNTLRPPMKGRRVDVGLSCSSKPFYWYFRFPDLLLRGLKFGVGENPDFM